MMSSKNDEDPFLQVQAEVLSALQATRPLFSSYLRIRSSASSASSPELIEARTELESTLQDLSTDLRDLVDSVKAVEHDPYKYGLEIDEVERRRRLVEEVGGEVEDMREELLKTVHDAQSKGKEKMGANGDALPHPSEFDDEEEGGDDYAAFEQERQMELVHEQDEALDGVFQTVGNLKQQAGDMGRELEEQAVILEDADNVADRVGGKLQNGIKKVGWVIKKNEVAVVERGVANMGPPALVALAIQITVKMSRKFMGIVRYGKVSISASVMEATSEADVGLEDSVDGQDLPSTWLFKHLSRTALIRKNEEQASHIMTPTATYAETLTVGWPTDTMLTSVITKVNTFGTVVTVVTTRTLNIPFAHLSAGTSLIAFPTGNVTVVHTFVEPGGSAGLSGGDVAGIAVGVALGVPLLGSACYIAYTWVMWWCERREAKKTALLMGESEKEGSVAESENEHGPEVVLVEKV
ncbi:hypothetical protein B0A49_01577 [Cryomyces minteri]|uniref:t-SNARE affecting a late Golgi compartment protein 1 n=1 Tax=Cryomyces minteri TaxID=331657 RepID=A0A4V6WL98_9PEZI|nr:hypothetical protein B0A49_01577 [Cryomyces minteri]